MSAGPARAAPAPATGAAVSGLSAEERSALDRLFSVLSATAVPLAVTDVAAMRARMREWFEAAIASDRASIRSGLRTFAEIARGRGPRQILGEMRERLSSASDDRSSLDLYVTVSVLLGVLTSHDRVDPLQQLIDAERWSDATGERAGR